MRPGWPKDNSRGSLARRIVAANIHARNCPGFGWGLFFVPGSSRQRRKLKRGRGFSSNIGRSSSPSELQVSENALNLLGSHYRSDVLRRDRRLRGDDRGELVLNPQRRVHVLARGSSRFLR